MTDSTLDELVSYFAPTVGHERSAELLETVARELGIALDALDERAITRILAALAQSPGIVGVAARFASQRRARRARTSAPAMPIASTRPRWNRPSSEPLADDASIERAELEALLGHSLDPRTASHTVGEFWQRAGIDGDRCSAARALLLLDAMAAREDAVAVAATFARARLTARRK